MALVPVIWIAGVLAVLFAAWLAKDVLARDRGDSAMQSIAGAIYEGAMAFLNRQYRTIAMLAVVAAILILLALGLSGDWDLGWHTAVAFIVGAACSALSGFIGMYVSVQANLRTAAAARRSLKEALTVSMRGGAVSGFMVVALSLLGVATIFYAYGGASNPAAAPFLIVGYGFGASFVALFAQLGGGIYTKAADVGADLVGKVEAGIPEDDPRNAAVIADLVGDNVGDCAGRGADLFESTAAENIGAMILGVALFAQTKQPAWIFFPLVVRAFGLIASIVGVLAIGMLRVEEPAREGEETVAVGGRAVDPAESAMKALNMGYYVTSILSIIFMFIASQVMLGEIMFFWAGVVGIVMSVLFVYITQYYTAGTWRPVREIAEACKTGPATTIISGIAIGFECTALPVIVISIALILSYWLGSNSGVQNGGIYGTAIATMGMLMTCAYILAMDTFGPITDNAGGINEMAHAPESIRRITDALDSVGNTTKALTKGYGIGSAALAAFLLFSAYLDKVAEVTGKPFNVVDLAKVNVFVAGLIGAMLVFFFSALAIRAVGKAAGEMIEEVRRQFREKPGIMAGTDRPDYARAVDISTRGALKQMVLPGLVAVITPIVVGVLLRAEAEAALLMVGTMAGILLATVMNNGGGAWDNAKKYIEAGHLKDDKGNVIGKGTVAHAAAVVGDTVGDPYKDTAGPSLHVLIKLLSTITLVLAPLFI